MKPQTKKITKTTTIADAMMASDKAAEILFGSGLHCVGCGMAMYETIEQGCLAHGMSPKQINKIIEEINGEKKGKKK